MLTSLFGKHEDINNLFNLSLLDEQFVLFDISFFFSAAGRRKEKICVYIRCCTWEECHVDFFLHQGRAEALGWGGGELSPCSIFCMNIKTGVAIVDKYKHIKI